MKTTEIEHALDELAHLSPTDTTEARAVELIEKIQAALKGTQE